MARKKGQMTFEQFWEMMQIVLVVALFIFSYLFISQHEKGTFIEKTYLTRDVSLLTSLSLASQGNIFYAYPKDLSQLSFEYQLKGSYIKIKAADDKIWTAYPFIKSEKQKVDDFGKKNIGMLTLNKKGNEFVLSDIPSQNMNAMNCPDIETYNKNWESEKIGIETGEKTKNIGNYLTTSKTTFAWKTDNSNDIQIALYEYNITDPNDNGAIIYINANSANSANSIKSQKMACYILNSLSENLPLSYSTVAIADMENMNKSSQIYKFLDNNKIALYIRYGNANITDNKLFQDYEKAGKSISKGIELYFTEKKVSENQAQ